MTDSLQDVVAAYVCGMTPGMNRVNLQLDGPIPEWADLGCHVRLSALAAPVVSHDAACILRDLVEALDGAFISSWQSTAAWSDQLNAARKHLAALSPGRSGEVDRG